MRDKRIHSRIIYSVACSLVAVIVLAIALFGFGSTAFAQNPPNVTAFPTIMKHPEMPSGSEATAVTILLNYYGVLTTKEEVGNKFPKEPLPVSVNERLVGGDPSRAFIGDPFSEEGLGSYQQPMLSVLREYSSVGQVIDRTKRPFLTVIQEVEKGNPMIVWVTEGMKPASLTLFWWTLENQLIQWHGNQNTVVLFDYDANHVYVSDPHTGQIEAYNRVIFERIWKDMGSRAVGFDSSVTETSAPNDQQVNEGVPIDSVRESFDYEEERRKLLKEIERQRDPSIAEREALEASQGVPSKSKFPAWGMWVVIVATVIFLASFATLLIITLKGRKNKKEPEKTKNEDEEQEE